MAVYTQVDEETLEELLDAYDVGPALSFKGIAEGVENSNYILTTGRGRFILTLYEKRVRAADLPFFLGLMEHLAARGLPCPVPIKRKDGATLSAVLGRPAALIGFLDGLSVTRPTVEHCRGVGIALANLHRLGADFPLTRENALGLKGWRALAGEIGASANKIAPDLAGTIAVETDFLAARWPSSLASGVIHGDLFPDNVLFRGSKVSGLIDFYFACNDMLILDLAVTLNAWCFEHSGEFNATKARALVSSYQSQRPLGRDEIEAFPVVARGAALRFLLTRTIDWLDQPPGALVRPKDPGEYLRKLKFHQGVAHVREYGFDV